MNYRSLFQIIHNEDLSKGAQIFELKKVGLVEVAYFRQAQKLIFYHSIASDLPFRGNNLWQKQGIGHKYPKALDESNFETVDFWTKKLSYHLSSHILHSIFWTNLTNKPTNPTGDLLKRIEKDFGSYDKLKMYLAKTSKEVDGNGWGILGYQPYTDKLTILQCENHEKPTQWGVIPLLVIDVWEHAYYLKFKNKRSDFVDNIFGIINWDNASQRLDTALKLVR